jgi:hypothetical protein
MEESPVRRGTWHSYTSRPGGMDRLPPDVRAAAEQREQRRGRLLCEVTVRVYENGAEPQVTFTAGAALTPAAAPAAIAAAVVRARDSLATWR